MDITAVNFQVQILIILHRIVHNIANLILTLEHLCTLHHIN